MLSESQLKFITDVLITIGEVSLASLVIPYVITSALSPDLFIAGLAGMVGSWVLGIAISKNLN